MMMAMENQEDANGGVVVFNEDSRIYEGQNRHEGLMRFMESVIMKNITHNLRIPAHIIKDTCRAWNQRVCVTPLDDREFERQWNAANEFVVEKAGRARAQPTDKRAETKKRKEQQGKGGAGGGLEEEAKLKKQYIQKYYEKQTGILYEAVIVAGRPYFVIQQRGGLA